MYPSPWTTSALICAIVMGAAFPPLAIIFIILAITEQGRLIRRHRAGAEKAYARAVQKRDREKAAALRYFAS